MTQKTSTKFGICGGQFVSETLMLAIGELPAGYGGCVDEFVVKRFEA